MNTMVENPCIFNAWESVVMCAASTLSVFACGLVLWLSFWLRLPGGRRLTILRQRTLTLGGYFTSLILGLFVCNKMYDVILVSLALLSFCYLSHLTWTGMEGWQVYRALVRKEQAQLLNDHFSWLGLLCVYIPPILAILSVLTLKGSTFEPIILFYETLFSEHDFDSDFWEQSHGKCLILTFANLFVTVIVVLFNLAILCLSMKSIRIRSRTLEAVSNTSQVSQSPRQALTILALGIVLGLNMATVVLIFATSPLLSGLGRLSIISIPVFFLTQFLMFNKAVKEALVAKAPWKKTIKAYSRQNAELECTPVTCEE